ELDAVGVLDPDRELGQRERFQVEPGRAERGVVVDGGDVVVHVPHGVDDELPVLVLNHSPSSSFESPEATRSATLSPITLNTASSTKGVGADSRAYGDGARPTSSSPFSSRTGIPGAGMSAGRCLPNRSVAMTPTSVIPYMLPSVAPYRSVKRCTTSARTSSPP